MCIEFELDEVFDCADEIKVYYNGSTVSYKEGCYGFNEIISAWNRMIDGSHLLPAFGVSLNGETVKALNSGLWVEFLFREMYESGGLPYEKLLINVEKNFSGFNIIRYTSDYGYDGRCFYYDLVNKNMNCFNDVLLKLLSNDK